MPGATRSGSCRVPQQGESANTRHRGAALRRITWDRSAAAAATFDPEAKYTAAVVRYRGGLTHVMPRIFAAAAGRSAAVRCHVHMIRWSCPAAGTRLGE